MTLPIRPLHNKIIFAFEERAVRNAFGQRTFESVTDSGIVVAGDHEGSSKQPRWGVVLAVGPKVDSEIKVGHRILIEALRWSNMVTHEGVDFWQTNDEEVLLHNEL